jgi:hypothetical protein
MTSSHEPFDDSAKAFYRKLFEDWGMVVETEREVFFRGRSIDLVVISTDEHQDRLQNTVFSYFRQINAIELKGIHDPLTMTDYNRIMMRVWGLGGLKPQEELEENEELEEENASCDEDILSPLPSQRTLTIICVTKPISILKQVDEFKFLKTKENGIYCYDGRFPQWIICPSELNLVEKNYPLLPLSRGKKLEQFISLCFRDGLIDYLRLIIDIGLYTDPDVILPKIMEMTQMKIEIHDETRLRIDQFFKKLPEEMWKLPTFKKAFTENQRLWELRGQQQSLQKVLIRQLRHKFDPIPDSVIQKIEATANLEQLDNWLDQVIVADSLAKTGLVSEEIKK